jgi:2-oxoglutarate dehydrogenase E1 component
VYYDLLGSMESSRVESAALVRIEQLYPLDLENLSNTVANVQHASKWVWCQEEPRNMGAWNYIAPLLEGIAGHQIQYAGRRAAASPAVGSKAWHDLQQKELVHLAFTV